MQGNNGTRSYLLGWAGMEGWIVSWVSVLRRQRWLQWSILIAMLLLWVRAVWMIYGQTGLFWWLGTDFTLYHAQSRALWSGDPSAIYNNEKLVVFVREVLSIYAHDYVDDISAHVPYPPLYAWLFTPFTIPSPALGLAFWEGLSFLALMYLVWRGSAYVEAKDYPAIGLMLLVSYPVMNALISAQPQILLACAVAEAYRSLLGGKDFRAGLWVACLLFKPQYGILLGVLLIWKRRWYAVGGALVGGGLIWGGSVLVAGLPACLAYPNAFRDMVGFRSYDAFGMINWRSIVLLSWPKVPEMIGFMLISVLGALTVGLAALVWRGPWDPASREFPGQFTVLLVATLLANYHSFSYGAVILALPLMALIGKGEPPVVTKLAVIAGVVFPSLAFSLGGHLDGDDSARASLMLKFFLLLCFFPLVAQLLKRQARRDEMRPSQALSNVL